MSETVTNIAGVFLNSEEATRLFTAINALHELVTLSQNLSVPVPPAALELINQELQFVLNADENSVFEFQSGDDDRLKHLARQKARLEAAVKALKGVPSVH